MKKFLKFIEEKIVPVTEQMAKQRHLKAVRDGVVHNLPLILLGSFFLLIAQPPEPHLQEWIKPYMPSILIPYRFTFGLISIYVACTVAYSLAKSYKMEGIQTAMLAGVTFLMSATPRVLLNSQGQPVAGAGEGLGINMETLMNWGKYIHNIPRSDLGWNLPIRYFGAEGLFLAIITAIVTVEILRYLKNKNLMFKMPESVPEVVAKAFEAIIPSFVIIMFFWILRDVLGLNLPQLVIQLFAPIKNLGDSIGAVIILTLIDSVCWFAGIHPVAVTGPFARPIWLALLAENASAAVTMGKNAILPHIAVDQFYFWFVWVGGAGGTLGLAIMLLLAKSRRLRQLGKVAIIPGLFNINEPIIFGLPIVANPMMIIPFALGPIVAGSVAYLAFHLDLATRPYLQAPWTMPAPLGAYFSTGGDWRAFVLSVVSILICSAVYYPFVRVYDKHMLEKELNGELEEKGKEEKKEEQPGTDSTEEPVEDNKKGE